MLLSVCRNNNSMIPLGLLFLQTSEKLRGICRAMGLLNLYPWRSHADDFTFVMPDPPISSFATEDDGVGFDIFKECILIKPVASYFVVTRSYQNWCNAGCRGVFSYDPLELPEVRRLLRSDDPRVQERISSHMVVLVGFGREAGVDYYLIRDSYDTYYNNGYKKIARNAFYGMVAVWNCWATEMLR